MFLLAKCSKHINLKNIKGGTIDSKMLDSMLTKTSLFSLWGVKFRVNDSEPYQYE